MSRVLIVDDHSGVREALALLCDVEGHEHIEAASPAEALALLEAQDVHLVLQDMNFTSDTTSGKEGVDLFRKIREKHPDLPIVLLTAWTHLEQAVSLVRLGAADYLSKPWDDGKLRATMRNLLELNDSRVQLRRLSAARQKRIDSLKGHELCGMVVADASTLELVQLALKLAPADIPILITGPNGAGKERIAEIIHRNSRVKEGPLITLNCGALPSELIEAELFGAEAGAYTGAIKAREGRFEAADGGTLFLDEIGNLSPSGQMKLLRVLETGRFERLGSNRTREAKVRVLSATNADLQGMIRAGKFREDLYYRLNVFELRLAPLRERRDDILPLAQHFLSGAWQLSEGAKRGLLRYDWPGNVRELKNAITRAQLLGKHDSIALADLNLPDLNLPATAMRPTSDEVLREPNKEHIEQALKSSRGVIAEAAGLLGMSRQALYRRMDRFGINRE